jgi:hypothetical protein
MFVMADLTQAARAARLGPGGTTQAARAARLGPGGTLLHSEWHFFRHRCCGEHVRS